MNNPNGDHIGQTFNQEGYLTCRGCKHYGIHDFHYEYCSAQPMKQEGYPWPGAGRQLPVLASSRGCPFPAAREEKAEGSKG